MNKTKTETHTHRFIFCGKAEPGYDYSSTFSLCSCGAIISHLRDGKHIYHNYEQNKKNKKAQ